MIPGSTPSVLSEVEELIALLEADIPANPQSPKNKKHEKRLDRLMAAYFLKLEAAFPYSKIDALYNKHVAKEAAIREAGPVDDTENILDPILRTFNKKLEADLEGQLAEVYISGQTEMITWGKTKGGVPIAFEGPPAKKAVDWAKAHVSKAKLVDGLNEETRRAISQVVSDGIKNKRGIPGIKSDIRHRFDWMARGAPSDIPGLKLASRAELIARTETANALSAASLETMEEMGINGKEWVTVGDSDVSEECLANEGQGVIPVGQTFSGGTAAPPQHPDCRCTVAPARLRR